MTQQNKKLRKLEEKIYMNEIKFYESTLPNENILMTIPNILNSHLSNSHEMIKDKEAKKMYFSWSSITSPIKENENISINHLFLEKKRSKLIKSKYLENLHMKKN